MSEISPEMRALCRRYKDLLPLKYPIKAERAVIATIPFAPVMTFISPKDLYREIAWFYLLHNKILADVKVIHPYEMVDIYLGKNTAVSSIFDINYPVVVFLLGYHELENRQLINVLNQYVAYRLTSNSLKAIVYFYKGKRSEFDYKYNSRTGPTLSYGKITDFSGGRSVQTGTSGAPSPVEF